MDCRSFIFFPSKINALKKYCPLRVPKRQTRVMMAASMKGIIMNLTGEVERNRGKLLAIIAQLFALARIKPGERPELDAEARTDVRMVSLPLYVCRKVMDLLVPAEAALRRLIIMAAHGLDFTPPSFRSPALGKSGARPEPEPAGPRARKAHPRKPPAFQMFDPLKPFEAYYRAEITGVERPFPDAFAPARGQCEPVNAVSLWRRINALSEALGTLPHMARRYLVWRARRDHARSNNLPLRPRRICTLLPRHPRGYQRNPVTDVHAVLKECNIFAWEILDPPPWRKDLPLR